MSVELDRGEPADAAPYSDEPPDVPRARKPYRNGLVRRRKIVESAARIFAAHGYAASSLKQVADEVGVTPAALNRHFEGKLGLLTAVLRDWDVRDDLPADQRKTGLAYFIELRRTVQRHTVDRVLIELSLTLSVEATNPEHPARDYITGRYDRVVAEAVGYLHEAIAVGDVLPMDDATVAAEVRGVFALMDGLQLQWLLNPSLDVVGVFSGSLQLTLERWTGRPFAWPTA